MISRKTPQCQSPRDCSDGLLVTISYWAVFVPKSRFRCLGNGTRIREGTSQQRASSSSSYSKVDGNCGEYLYAHTLTLIRA